MSLNHYSKLVAIIIGLVLIGGMAGATSMEQTGVDPAEIGSDVVVETMVTELYITDTGPIDVWTLRGESLLESVTWTVTEINAADRPVEETRKVHTGKVFQQGVSLDDSVVKIKVEVSGTIPEVAEWTYEPRQSVLVMELSQMRLGGTREVIGSIGISPYTTESKAAREAIDIASVEIEQGGGNTDAIKTLANSISAYNVGNFDNARDLAKQAKETAVANKESTERKGLILNIVGLVIAVALIGGIIMWYQSTRHRSRL
tara:strand:+ start:7136 stop:7912 length:777 start_codon:yes stop_codon:yes gene_type:complete